MKKPTQDEANRRLFSGAQRSDDRAVQAALEAGADPNARGPGGETPLHWAAAIGSTAIAQLLVDAGADANAKSKTQQTPLHWIGPLRTRTAQLLIDNGADLNSVDNEHHTPFEVASIRGYTDVAAVLDNAAKQQGHAGRVAKKRKDKGPPQVGG